MGKRKRLHIISVSEVQQPTEVEQSFPNPAEASSSEASHQQNPSYQIHATTSSEATTDSAQSVSGSPKRVRGPTRKQAIWDMVEDRIVVNFDETGQPVGDEGNEFTNFLGTVVKMPQHVSINCRDWRKISEDKKEDLWSIVTEKFSFESADTEKIRVWALSDMGNKLKSWRYELKKKFYDESLTIDEIVASQNDERVDKGQFKELVTHWFDQKTQMESETKKTIRSKSNEPHVTGTKSFARITHDETQKTGVAPSRGGLYCISRTRKNGSISSVPAAKVIDALKNINNTATSTSHVGLLNWKDDDLAKVKGPEKRGHIRCRGKIVKAIRKGSHASQVPQLKARVNELENEVKELKETQKEMVRFMASFKAANGCPPGKSAISRASSSHHCPAGNPTSSHSNADMNCPGEHSTSSRASAYKHCPSGNLTSRSSEDYNSGMLF